MIKIVNLLFSTKQGPYNGDIKDIDFQNKV